MSNFTANSSGTYLIHDYDTVLIDLATPGPVTLVGGGAELHEITIDYSGKDTQPDYVEIDLATFKGDIHIDVSHYDTGDEIKLLGATLTGPEPGYPDKMGFTYVGADGATYTGKVHLDEHAPRRGFSSDPSPIIICFAKGTALATPTGETKVEDLRIGDKLLTHSGKTVTARWIGHRKVSCLDLMRHPALRPIRVEAGALAPGIPQAALTVSPLHRIAVLDHRSQMLFGHDQVLAAATHLVNGRTIRRDDTAAAVTYFHVFTGAHDILIANGAPAESLYLGEIATRSLSPAALTELSALCPDHFRGAAARPTRTCAPILSRRDCQLLLA